MKKSILAGAALVCAALVVNISPVRAQMGSMMGGSQSETTASSDADHHTDTVEAVLADILKAHNVTTVQQLDYASVTDEEWERLGDAVMEQNHPGEAHEAMDRMMGGEGSESLRSMHIAMGKRYLGGGQNDSGFGMMGSSVSPAGFPMTGFGGMMNTESGIFPAAGAALWISAVAFFLSGTYFFLRRANRK